MPTISLLTFCPNEESIPTEIPSGPVMLARSNSLCILTKAVVADSAGKLSNIAPVALSYDGRAWEKAAGEFAMKLLYGQDFSDYANSGSQITLPGLNGSGKYYLTSYNRTISEADKVARLLETGTFGTMAKDLASFPTLTEATAKQWIVDQMNTNITSHREYFRKRANPRVRKHGSYFVHGVRLRLLTLICFVFISSLIQSELHATVTHVVYYLDGGILPFQLRKGIVALSTLSGFKQNITT